MGHLLLSFDVVSSIFVAIDKYSSYKQIFYYVRR